MTTEVIVTIKCEPVSEVTESELPSPRCDYSGASYPNCKPLDSETSHSGCEPESSEHNKHSEPKHSEREQACSEFMDSTCKPPASSECEPVYSEPQQSACKPPATGSSEVLTVNANPEFVCVKPEPLDNFTIEFEEIHNDEPHLVEIKKEQTDDDDDDDDDCDRDSNESAEDAELPPFDVSEFKRSSDGQYQCPACQKWLSKKGNLQRHLQIHSKEKLTCKYCGLLLPQRELLKAHIAEEHKKVFQCEECHKMFRTSSNLNQHMRSHVKPYQCELCDRRFATMGNLTKHKGKRRCKKPNSEPLHCDICEKDFRTPYLYKSHQVMHSTERPFECDICRMTFKQTSALTRHMQLHNNDKPYSCDICGKKFTSKGLLKPHMRSHTGERPFTCPICQKSFAHKHNMLKHSLLHNIVKHLICEICHKEFPRESRLKYHMRKHMADNKPFKCEHCPKSYSCKQNMVRHYKKKHPTKNYVIQETDASIATVMWETVIKKQLEVQTDYILPDEDVPVKEVYD